MTIFRTKHGQFKSCRKRDICYYVACVYTTATSPSLVTLIRHYTEVCILPFCVIFGHIFSTRLFISSIRALAFSFSHMFPSPKKGTALYIITPNYNTTTKVVIYPTMYIHVYVNLPSVPSSLSVSSPSALIFRYLCCISLRALVWSIKISLMTEL